MALKGLTVSFFSDRTPKYKGPGDRLSTWFTINNRDGEYKWVSSPAWNCLLTNENEEEVVLKSLTFNMGSCNSAGKQFLAQNSSNSSTGLVRARGSGFTLICEISTDDVNYSRYGSGEVTIPKSNAANYITISDETLTTVFETSRFTFNFTDVPAIMKGGKIYVKLKIIALDLNTSFSGNSIIATTGDTSTVEPEVEPEKPEEPEVKPDPNPPSIPMDSKMITNTQITSLRPGVKKNYKCQIRFSTPDGYSLKEAKVTGGSGGTVSASVSGNTVTCTATRNNTDYPKYENFTLTVKAEKQEEYTDGTDEDGNPIIKTRTLTSTVSSSFTIAFHNMPTAKISLNHKNGRKVINIRTASQHEFVSSAPNDNFEIALGRIWVTDKQSDELTLTKKTFASGVDKMNVANHMSDNLRFLSTISNSGNIFKVSRENRPNKVKFKLFNYIVQDLEPDTAYSITTVIDNVVWSISPKDIRQLSFDWVQGNSVIATVNATGANTCRVSYRPGYYDLPETAVIGLSGNSSPTIGNLRYGNDDSVDTAGYCRGFRVEYMRSKNESEDSVARAGRAYYYDKTEISSSPQVIVRNRLTLDIAVTRNLPKFTDLYIRITPYFYFGPNRVSNSAVSDTASTNEDSRRYFGASFTLPQKFVYMTDGDLYTPFLFPVTKTTQPSTPMLLPQVEKTGNIIKKDVIDYRDVTNHMDFGLYIGTGNEISVRKTPDYFSAPVPQNHMVGDIGKVISDLSERDGTVLSPSLEIYPFVDLYYNRPYHVRISTKNNVTVSDTGVSGNTAMILQSSIRLDTRKESMWDRTSATPVEGIRPEVNKGELIFYHDYDNFQVFMDKYRNLIPNRGTNPDSFTVKPVPVSKTSEVISTDFWIEIARRISVYSDSMQNWVTSSNSIVWAFPRFTIVKGTVIENLNILASLFQNFWDLLNKCNGKKSFATHKYLHDMGYTHKMLSRFTHKQIMNKEGL